MGSSQFLCFLSLMLIQFGLHINAQPPTYIYTLCDQRGNYTNGSKFQSNLNLLLSSLSSNAVTVKNGFSNSTIGSKPDKVHGLFLCIGNVSTEVCKNCVKNATEKIIENCPNNKKAIVWYDECMLRYSNRSIFSVMEETPALSLWNMNNVSDPNLFKPILEELMQGLVSNATKFGSSSKFATGEANFNSSQKIYGSAQCTPDLSPTDCSKCLQSAISEIPNCCNGKQGARVLQPSCNVRYELYNFYGPDQADAPALSPSLPPPTLPPSTSTTPTNGKGKNSSNIVLSVAITLVLSLMLTGDAITELPLPSPSTFLERSLMQSDMPTEDHKSKAVESDKSTTNSSKPWSVIL